MSNTSNALEQIITSTFDGNKSLLGKKSGLSSGMMTKITKGESPLTHKTLKSICDVIPPDSARSLCLAVCRDLLPYEYRDSIAITTDLATADHHLNEDPAPYITGPQLDAKSIEILNKLRTLSAAEPETKAWLHRLGTWLPE